MIQKLLIKYLVKMVGEHVNVPMAKNVVIGGTIEAKGVAHGIKAFGHVWELDLKLRRTK